MGLFSKTKNKFSKIAISFSLLLATVAGVFGLNNVGWSAQGSNNISNDYKGLSISYSANHKNSSWSLNGDTLTGMASEYYKVPSNQASESTVYVENLLNFNVSVVFTVSFSDLDKGELIGDYTIRTDNSYLINLKRGASFSVYIKSKTTSIWASAIKGTAAIEFQNVSIVNPVVSFEMSDFGTYSVDGEIIQNTGKKVTIFETTTFSLKLESTAAGYSFAGWKLNNKTVSSAPEYSVSVEEDCVIKPYFKNDSYATFKVGQTTYDDFAEAISVARSGNDKNIIAAKTGEIPAGEYSIPSGVTLYIPNDESSYADYKKDDGSYTTTSSTLSLYRKITLSNGCKITCQNASSIVVCCQILASSNAQNSTPTGSYGEIHMQNGSSITLASGSHLYAWGFVSYDTSFSDVAVVARSGSTVHEMFQILDWRGGTATLNMVNNDDKKIFVFNQYYVQNIEAPLKLEYGAIEKGLVAIEASSVIRAIPFTFIGDSSGGMFRLSEGAYLIKKYIQSGNEKDRIQFEIFGNSTLSSIEFTVKGVGIGSATLFDIKIKSQNFILPINNNFDVFIRSGTVSIDQNQSLAFLPGSRVFADNGASLELNSDAIFYNLSDWEGHGFSRSLDFVQVPRISSGAPASRKPLTRGAFIDINGSVVVKSTGHLYSTTGELNSTLNEKIDYQAKAISSKKTGNITFASGAATNSTTYQLQTGKDITKDEYTEIKIQNIQLYNGDSSIYDDAIKANEKIPYSTIKDMWGDATYKERTGLYLQDDGKIAYYNTKGVFETKTGVFYYDNTVYPCGDNEYYLLTNGFVEVFKGIYRDSSSTSYYFFGEANIAYRNGTYSITNTSKLGNFFPGTYRFDANGKLLSVTSTGNITSQLIKYVDGDKLMMDGVIAGIGLFEDSDGYIYCSNDSGSIVKNSTYYVSKTNGVQDAKNNDIKAGLYWFDSNGHLCDSSLQPIKKGS